MLTFYYILESWSKNDVEVNPGVSKVTIKLQRNIKYLNQIKQKKGKSLVKQAYTYYDMSQSQNRLSIENSAIKLNDNLKTLLNKEIDIFKLPKIKLKHYIEYL